MLSEMDMYAEPARVASRLAALGLEWDELMESVRAGFIAQWNTTEHHPKTAGGFNRWSEGFAALCDPLAKRGWRKIEIENVPLVVDDTRKIAIAVQSGNRATGIDPASDAAGMNLRTRRPKGPGAGYLIDETTGVQPSLLALLGEGTPPEWVRPHHLHGYSLYLLLSFEDAGGGRAELARPKFITATGEITDWSERIILGDLRDELPGEHDVAEPDEPISSEFTVLRKAI